MAATRFSLPQLARLIEEVKWGIDTGTAKKGTVKKIEPAKQIEQFSSSQRRSLRRPKPSLLRQLQRAPRLLSNAVESFDLSAVSDLISQRRLLRRLPWSGVGLAIATVEPKLAFALLLGGSLGWGIWWLQKGEGVGDRGVGEKVRQRIDALGLTVDQRRWMVAIAAGGAMALSAYGSLVLWDNFHNAWLVAGVVGQSGLTLSLALAWFNREQQREDAEGIERFHRLLESLLTAPVDQRPVLIQQLLWLGLKGRLDGYQQGIVLQTFQGLFMGAEEGAEKERLSQAIAQFQQLQHLHPTGRPSYALGSATLGKVDMPLASQLECQSEAIARLKPLKNSPSR